MIRTLATLVLALAVVLAGCGSNQPAPSPSPSPPPSQPQPSGPPPQPSGPPPQPVGPPPGPIVSPDGHVWHYYPTLEMYYDETTNQYWWRQNIGWFGSANPPRDLNPSGHNRVNVMVARLAIDGSPTDDVLAQHRVEYRR